MLLRDIVHKRVSWEDVENKYVLLVGGFDGNFTDRTRWVIARIDDIYEQAETYKTGHYYEFGRSAQNFDVAPAPPTKGEERGRPEEAIGLIHTIFPDFETAKAAKDALVALTLNYVIQLGGLKDSFDAQLTKIGAAEKTEVIPLRKINGMQELGFATTVGQLIDGLLKFDRKMPLVSRGGSGNFSIGAEVYEVTAMEHKKDPGFFANRFDKVWKDSHQLFEKPFKAIMIWI